LLATTNRNCIERLQAGHRMGAALYLELAREYPENAITRDLGQRFLAPIQPRQNLPLLIGGCRQWFTDASVTVDRHCFFLCEHCRYSRVVVVPPCGSIPA
jgi:hypothetical protein